MSFQAISASSDTALVVSDRDGNYLYSNTANDRLMKAKPRQVLGKNWRDFVSPHEIARLTDFEAQAFRGRPVGYEVLARRADGMLLPLNINLLRMGGRKGSVLIVTCRPLIVRRDKNQDIASYVADLATQLGDMAEQADFALLATHLRTAASVAGEELEKLGGLVPATTH